MTDSLPRHDRELPYDLLSKPFVFPRLTGKTVLVLGVGGGCDIISAFALSQMLKEHEPATIVYANTKTKIREQLQPLSTHVLRVPEERIVLSGDMETYGMTLIEQSLPRGDCGCPWIFLLSRGEQKCAELVAEIQELLFDVIVSVDTGADSIVSNAASGPEGRDQRMMRVLGSVGTRWRHVVISPGCDGETSYLQLQTAMNQLESANRYAGCFSLEPLVPFFREASAGLENTRTPNIIVDAYQKNLRESSDGRLVVPRGWEPEIPRSWLLTAFVIQPEVDTDRQT